MSDIKNINFTAAELDSAVKAKDAKCEHMNADGTFNASLSGGSAFDTAVKHFQSACGGGHSEDSAKKIAGAIAQKVGAAAATVAGAVTAAAADTVTAGGPGSGRKAGLGASMELHIKNAEAVSKAATDHAWGKFNTEATGGSVTSEEHIASGALLLKHVTVDERGWLFGVLHCCLLKF